MCHFQVEAWGAGDVPSPSLPQECGSLVTMESPRPRWTESISIEYWCCVEAPRFCGYNCSRAYSILTQKLVLTSKAWQQQKSKICYVDLAIGQWMTRGIQNQATSEQATGTQDTASVWLLRAGVWWLARGNWWRSILAHTLCRAQPSKRAHTSCNKGHGIVRSKVTGIRGS